MNIKAHTRGFSLIEMMIVVAITGLLAAIAAPRYLRYQLRARQTEGYVVLSLIKAAQITHNARNDCFATANVNPNVGVLSSSKRLWDDTTSANANQRCPGFPGAPLPKNFADLQVEPAAKNVYLQYSCIASYDAPGSSDDFACCAQGDLDDDGNLYSLLYGTDNAGTGTTLANPACSGLSSAFPNNVVRVSAALY